MLDQLESLDDTSPPVPDTALLAKVRRRADRRRRRTRWAEAGACVVLVAVALGVVALLKNDTKKVDVVGPSRKPIAKDVVSEGHLANGLTFRMTVETTSVVLGDSISVTIGIRNDTGKTQNIGPSPDVECALGAEPTLLDSAGNSNTVSRGLSCLQNRGITPGASRVFHTEVSTDGLSLPAGQQHARYKLVLEYFPELRSEAPSPSPPIAIDVSALALTADLAVTTPTVESGGVIHGSIVFDNTSNASIDAGCLHSLSYRVSLAAGDVVLNPRTFASIISPSDGSCRKQVRLLPPGISRFPFKVTAEYFGCSPDFARPPIPRCVGHLQTPTLPPGRYEVIYEGRGPLGAVEVEPVVVTVISIQGG
jgi:hypothetical protein